MEDGHILVKNFMWVLYDIHYTNNYIYFVHTQSVLSRVKLTLKCLSYFSLRLCTRGVHLDPFILEYFPIEISLRNLHHKCIHPKQPYISKKKDKKCYVAKWRPKNDFSLCQKGTWPKFEKTLSQRNFSIKFSSKLKNMNTFTFLKIL